MPTTKFLSDCARAQPRGDNATSQESPTSILDSCTFSNSGQSEVRRLLFVAEEFHRRTGARVAEHFARQLPLLPKAGAQVHVDVPSDWNDAAAGACSFCESICLC